MKSVTYQHPSGVQRSILIPNGAVSFRIPYEEKSYDYRVEEIVDKGGFLTYEGVKVDTEADYGKARP